MQFFKELILFTAVLLGGMVVCAGCSSRDKGTKENVVAVHTVTVAKTTGNSQLSYVGTIEEETGASLSFKVQGNVQRIFVEEGQRVGKETLLAELDAETLQQSYNAAKATYEQAEDALQRMQLLYDNKSLSEIKYVEVQTKLEQAKSMFQIAKQNLADARLVSPGVGIIGRRSVEVGENVMPGQPVFTLLNIQAVKVKIAVPEREIARLSAMQTEAQVTVPALGDKQYTGKITEKGIVADAATHTYEAKIKLANPEGALMPGMVCNVTVLPEAVKQEASIVLPNRAVQVSDTDRHFVWAVKNGEATAVKVEIGGLTDRGVIIEKGLDEGMEVIIEGMQKVSEGMKVKAL